MSLDRALRLAGAVLLLVGGAIHLQLLLDDYGTTSIGRAFVANVALSALVAAYLTLREDLLGVAAGLLVSVGSLVALALTRTGDGILGFRESGLVPSPQTISTIVAEVAAIAALGALLMHRHGSARSPR